MRNDSTTVNGICVGVNNCVTREVQVFRVQKKQLQGKLKRSPFKKHFAYKH